MDTAWITADDLLNWAATQGHNPTRRQLERWRKDDLLPRPRRVSLGRGRGVRSEYPFHAREQLLALCRLHEHERRLDHVCFQLWRQGYSVPGPRLKAALHHLALAPLSEIAVRYADADEAAVGLSVQMMADRDRSGLRRRVRQQRLTDAEMQRLFVTAVQLFLGASAVFMAPSASDAHGTLTAAELWVRGLGLEAARTETLAGAPPWLGSDVASVLARFEEQGMFSVVHLAQTLAAATDEQLTRARDDLERLAGALAQFGALLQVMGAPPIFGWVWELMNPKDPALAAFLVLALLSARHALGDEPFEVLGGTLAREQSRGGGNACGAGGRSCASAVLSPKHWPAALRPSAG